MTLAQEILEYVRDLGAVEPEALVKAFPTHHEEDVRSRIRSMLDDGSFGLDLNWKICIGDGVGLWP